jgi:hypothetical protein
MNTRFGYAVSVFLFAALASACVDGGSSAGNSPAVSGLNQRVPAGKAERGYTTDALLFTGSGTWGTEVTALGDILTKNGATFKEVGSSEMDAMSVDELAKFGVIIFPGGAGGTEASGLTAQTHANLRAAVQERGVSYIGFCAGAFIAQAPAPAPGGDVSYGLGIVDGPVLDYPSEFGGDGEFMTQLSFADGSTKSVLWYGGPASPNQGVIARYPGGEPAISELWSGKGFVVISGPHPAIAGSTLSSLGMSTENTDTELAWKLIHAAMTQQPLASF